MYTVLVASNSFGFGTERNQLIEFIKKHAFLSSL
jgi:hypothetical protein